MRVRVSFHWYSNFGNVLCSLFLSPFEPKLLYTLITYCFVFFIMDFAAEGNANAGGPPPVPVDPPGPPPAPADVPVPPLGPVPAPGPVPVPAPVPVGEPILGLMEKSLAALKAECRRRLLPYDGTKAVLQRRLRESVEAGWNPPAPIPGPNPVLGAVPAGPLPVDPVDNIGGEGGDNADAMALAAQFPVYDSGAGAALWNQKFADGQPHEALVPVQFGLWVDVAVKSDLAVNMAVAFTSGVQVDWSDSNVYAVYSVSHVLLREGRSPEVLLDLFYSFTNDVLRPHLSLKEDEQWFCFVLNHLGLSKIQAFVASKNDGVQRPLLVAKVSPAVIHDRPHMLQLGNVGVQVPAPVMVVQSAESSDKSRARESNFAVIKAGTRNNPEIMPLARASILKGELLLTGASSGPGFTNFNKKIKTGLDSRFPSTNGIVALSSSVVHFVLLGRYGSERELPVGSKRDSVFLSDFRMQNESASFDSVDRIVRFWDTYFLCKSLFLPEEVKHVPAQAAAPFLFALRDTSSSETALGNASVDVVGEVSLLIFQKLSALEEDQSENMLSHQEWVNELVAIFKVDMDAVNRRLLSQARADTTNSNKRSLVTTANGYGGGAKFPRAAGTSGGVQQASASSGLQSICISNMSYKLGVIGQSDCSRGQACTFKHHLLKDISKKRAKVVVEDNIKNVQRKDAILAKLSASSVMKP